MAKNNTPVDKNSREYLLRQVANGRYSLLLIVILTVVNLIMTILDTNTYFLFSASVPYYLVFVGMGIENGFVDGAWNVKGTLTYTGHRAGHCGGVSALLAAEQEARRLADGGAGAVHHRHRGAGGHYLCSV